MTLDDFRKLRDDAQREWNKKRNIARVIRNQIDNLWDAHQAAHTEEDAAHRAYKQAKEVFRVARDFNLTDLDQALVVLKLRDGGRG